MEKTVYITKSNFWKIANQVKSAESRMTYEEFYKSDISKHLSKKEISYLEEKRNMLRDRELSIDHYRRIERPVDRNFFVYEGQIPSYHFDKYCQNIKSDFLNLEIPLEIKTRGPLEIELFREFCKSNIDLLKDDEDKFWNMVSAKFILQSPIKTINQKNSGLDMIDNYTVEDLEEKIDLLLSEMEIFRNRDDETSEKINRFGYGTDRCAEKDIDGSILQIWHEYKSKLKNLFILYFRIRFNPDFEFKASLLDSLGFKPCKACQI